MANNQANRFYRFGRLLLIMIFGRCNWWSGACGLGGRAARGTRARRRPQARTSRVEALAKADMLRAKVICSPPLSLSLSIVSRTPTQDAHRDIRTLPMKGHRGGGEGWPGDCVSLSLSLLFCICKSRAWSSMYTARTHGRTHTHTQRAHAICTILSI